MAKPPPCSRSVLRGATPTAEEFCDNPAYFQVVVTFNGHRYLVDLCEKHKAEHDDAAARRRQARRVANKKAEQNFFDRHPQLITP